MQSKLMQPKHTPLARARTGRKTPSLKTRLVKNSLDFLLDFRAAPLEPRM